MNEHTTGLTDYLQKETEYLRTRLSANIDETAALERSAIAVTGAMWAWIGTHTGTAVPVLSWMPLILTAFLGLRAVSVYFRIKTIYVYLAKLETAANVPQGLGWVAAFESSGARYRVRTAWTFWAAVSLANIGAALLTRGSAMPFVTTAP